MKKTKLTIILFLAVFAISHSLPVLSQGNDTDAASGRYGSDSTTCLKNLSLYREAFKTWKASNYLDESVKKAIRPWRWVFLNCPGASQNIYIEGAKIMAYMIEKASDESLRGKYVDTLMMLYDQRIKYFGKEGYVLGRKGMDLSVYRPEATGQIYSDLERSVELEGGNSAGPVLVAYLKAAARMVHENPADSAIIFEAYDKCLPVIDHNLEKNKDNPDEKANWEIVAHNAEVVMDPFTSCKDIVSIFGKKYNEKQDEKDLIKKIAMLLDAKKCYDDSLYYETTRKFYTLAPSPLSSYLYGKMLMVQGNFAGAVGFFTEGEKMEDPLMVQKDYKYLCQAYRSLRNFPDARLCAQKAIALNPADGEAYLMIGDMYAESARDCGDNELSQRSAYWAAVDQYLKAEQVDPSVTQIAEKRISAYSAYFPSAETIMKNGLKEGELYKTGCWINEESRVRAAK